MPTAAEGQGAAVDLQLELLKELVEQVKGLRADLAHLGRPEATTGPVSRTDQAPPGRLLPESLRRADLELLGALLPAQTGAHGSDPFTSRDLAADSSLGVRLVLRGRSAKSIGKLLARAEGIPIGGWLGERSGVEIAVVLRRVVAC